MFKKMFNFIFSCALSLLVLNSILHIDPYQDVNMENYGLCNPGCDNEEHFSKIYDCDKIQNNNKKSILIHQGITFIDVESKFFEFLKNKNRESSRSFSLYSRPPPNYSC